MLLQQIKSFVDTYNWNKSIHEWRRDVPRENNAWQLSKLVFASAKVGKTKRYLEIGVRDGDSLVSFLRAQTDVEKIVLCDTWGKEYGGSGRGGPRHVEKLLSTFGVRSKTEIYSMKSQEAIPQLKEEFDLITVDGDHSEEGARTDLENCWQVLAPGGILLLDDIMHPAHMYLECLLKEFIKEKGITESDFFYEKYGVGIIQKDTVKESDMADVKKVQDVKVKEVNTEIKTDAEAEKKKKEVEEQFKKFNDAFKEVNDLLNSDKFIQMQADAQKKIDDYQNAAIAELQKKSAEITTVLGKIDEEKKKILADSNDLKAQVADLKSKNAKLESDVKILNDMILGGATVSVSFKKA